jgi:hypothetical protein
MTFLEELTAHKGGLILLKGELYWYGGRGWDGCPGRICLLMDSAPAAGVATAAVARCALAAAASLTATPLPPAAAGVLLLIDGRPHWVWVAQEDVELL